MGTVCPAGPSLFWFLESDGRGVEQGLGKIPETFGQLILFWHGINGGILCMASALVKCGQKV